MRTKLSKIILVSCTCLFSTSVFAGFSTYSNNWPDGPATVDEKVSSKKKQAPASTEKANACGCDGLSKQAVINDEQRISEQKRLYAKFGATFLTAQIRNITNVSLPALSNAYLLSNSASKNYLSWEFGLGTKISAIRVEAEYLYEKNVQYNPTPLFANRAENLNSKLMSQSIWFNLLWDLDKLNLPYFTPYIGVSGGFVWNKTRSTMYGGTGNNVAQNHSRYALGWGGTIGVRVPFWSRWFGYIGYKYLDHGMARWQSSSGIMQLKGHYVVQGFDVGVQYLLG